MLNVQHGPPPRVQQSIIPPGPSMDAHQCRTAGPPRAAPSPPKTPPHPPTPGSVVFVPQPSPSSPLQLALSLTHVHTAHGTHSPFCPPLPHPPNRSPYSPPCPVPVPPGIAAQSDHHCAALPPPTLSSVGPGCSFSRAETAPLLAFSYCSTIRRAYCGVCRAARWGPMWRLT